MSFRLVAQFLALVLLWSSLGTVEAPLPSASPWHEPSQALVESHGRAAGHPGSVEHHHLDDMPSQAQNDPPIDLQDMLPASGWASTGLPPSARPPSLRTAAAGPPCAGRLLRPPCHAAIAG